MIKAIRHTDGNELQLVRDDGNQLVFQVIGEASSKAGKELARALEGAVDAIQGFTTVKFTKGKVLAKYDVPKLSNGAKPVDDLLREVRLRLGQNVVESPPRKQSLPAWQDSPGGSPLNQFRPSQRRRRSR